MEEREIEALVDEALDAACAAIQNKLGVTDGGFAGMYFSGPSHPIRAELEKYIRAEIAEAQRNG